MGWDITPDDDSWDSQGLSSVHISYNWSGFMREYGCSIETDRVYKGATLFCNFRHANNVLKKRTNEVESDGSANFWSGLTDGGVPLPAGQRLAIFYSFLLKCAPHFKRGMHVNWKVT
jgi:hypothetical protein